MGGIRLVPPRTRVRCATRQRPVYTLLGLGVPDVSPAAGSAVRCPLPSTGSSRHDFPGFVGTMRHSDSLNVFGTGFLVVRRPLPPRASVFDLPPGPNASPGAWGHWVRRLPVRSFNEEERQGLSSSQATLVCLVRVLGPRRERVCHGRGEKRRGPASGNNKGSPRGRQSRGSIARPEH